MIKHLFVMRSYVRAVSAACFGGIVLLSAATAIAQNAGGEARIVHDFETDTYGWAARGEADSVTVEQGPARSGESALRASGRTESWNGPILDLAELASPGGSYRFSLWAKLPGMSGMASEDAPSQSSSQGDASGESASGEKQGVEGPPEQAELRVSLQSDQGGESAFVWLDGNRSVGPGDWVEFKGSFDVPEGLDGIAIYVESDASLSDILIDDFRLVRLPPPEVQAIPPLKDVLEEQFPIGVAIDQRETQGRSAELLLRHFGQITAENHMKPIELQPVEGEFTFEKADALVDFATQNDLRIYGHTLVWYNQTPEWFFEDENGKPLTDSPAHQQILLDRLQAHIQAVAERYGDNTWAWDVVNEAVDESQDDGLRRSRWYEVLGADYIAHAFRFAREAFGPDVKLFINDYSTEFPAKREVYYTLIEGLLADGVPIDGVGHQLHVSLTRPPAMIDKTLTRFTDLGLLQAITELDISISASASESLPAPPEDRVIRQGYYVRDLMEVLRKHSDQIASLSVWGLQDARSWLKTWPIDRPHEAPLLFDGRLQAKPAYWGIVNPEKLPHYPRTLAVPEAEIVIDDTGDDAWSLLPYEALEGGDDEGETSTSFQARWLKDTLFLRVENRDRTADVDDMIELFVADTHLTFPRSGQRNGQPPKGTTASIDNTQDGYSLEVAVPVGPGDTLPFDLRVTDETSGQVSSWSDQSHEQETTDERFGTLERVEALRAIDVPESPEAPTLDARHEALWDQATEVSTTVNVEGAKDGAQATMRLLWHDGTLFVLADVADVQLDAGNSNPWEQDSIEIFVAPGNEKDGVYRPADGQYRVGADNHQSISGDLAVIGESLESAADKTDDGYRVEAAIELGRLEADQVIGLELQVNDASDAVRTSVHAWNDASGQSYQDTSVWGTARLVPARP